MTVVFPIIHHGEVLGFVGRRHPNLTDGDRQGPKYLNTADTPLFHKGAQLFGLLEQPLADGAIPVIVEGPMDAVAVTIASGGRYLGVATLGTSLTDEQAAELTSMCRHPVVATDVPVPRSSARRTASTSRSGSAGLSHDGMTCGVSRCPHGQDPHDQHPE